MELILLVLGIVLLALWFAKRRQSAPVVVDIVIYPIKSCGEYRVSKVAINNTGMIFDREWVLLTPNNQIVTQRENSKLLRLMPNLIVEGEEIKAMELSLDGQKIRFSPVKTGEVVKFECKSVMCEGIEEGKEVAEFLRKVFVEDYRLVRVFKHRQLNKHPRYQGLVSDDYKTTFMDAAQFLILSEESFNLTRDQLPKEKKDGLDMVAFRGNIVVRGCRPFEEDTWSRFQIGNVEFQGIGRCPRCKITTVNIKTLEYDDNYEPVTTLRKLNGNGTKGYLGMHCVRLNNAETPGEIQVGQRVLVKDTKKFPDI